MTTKKSTETIATPQDELAAIKQQERAVFVKAITGNTKVADAAKALGKQSAGLYQIVGRLVYDRVKSGEITL